MSTCCEDVVIGTPQVEVVVALAAVPVVAMQPRPVAIVTETIPIAVAVATPVIAVVGVSSVQTGGTGTGACCEILVTGDPVNPMLIWADGDLVYTEMA